MKTFIPGSCTIEQTAVDVFLRHDGKRIAKLGRPKLHAPPNWVSVASGYTVQEYHGHGIGELLVTRDGVAVL